MKKIIRLDSSDSVAYNNIGVLLGKLNKHEEAIDNFDKAIHFNPSYFRAYVNRGVSLSALKRNNESIQSFDMSIEIKPNSDAYFFKANLFFELNSLPEAIKCYDVILTKIAL